MSGGAPKTQTVTQESKSEPWEAAQPFLQQAMAAAAGQFGQGVPSFYPGVTTAPMREQTAAGLQNMQDVSAMAAPLANQALGATARVMNAGPGVGAGHLARAAAGGAPNPFTAAVGAAAAPSDRAPIRTAAAHAGSNPFVNAVAAAGQAPTNLEALYAASGRANPAGDALAGMSGSQIDASGLNPFRQGIANAPAANAVNAAQGGYAGPGMDALGQFASGQMLDNPYLDAMYERQAEQIRNQINAQFAQSGRYASGAHQDVLQEGLTNLATDWYGQNYQSAMNRMLQAAGQRAGFEGDQTRLMVDALGQQAGFAEADANRRLAATQAQIGVADADRSFGADAMRAAGGFWGDNLARAFSGAQTAVAAQQTDLARALASAQAAGAMTQDARALQGSLLSTDLNAQQNDFARLGDIRMGQASLTNQDFANALNAYNALATNDLNRNAQTLTAAGMTPGFYDFARQGATDMMGVGAALEGYDQQAIAEAMERYNYQVNAPWQLISQLNAIASGQGQLGGSATGTNQVPYQASNPFLQGIGAIGSIGTAAGALAKGVPALLTALGTSDVRLKRDAAPIGIDERGVRWWRYRYLWDEPGMSRVGVMAQELAGIAPQFVYDVGGYLAVDYDGLSRWEAPQ